MTVLPDSNGRFGIFGGQYVPETLMSALHELTEAWLAAKVDEDFQAELTNLLCNYVGRPTPLHYAVRLTSLGGGPGIYLKREDLAHTGAHKINNALGQGLLAKRMGKSRIVAETGAGQHGVATATVCALLDLQCVVYMGEEDIRRQAPNVYRMKMLGAEVRPVTSGTRTLKEAVSETIRDWVTNVEDTHYIIGSAVGPHPYPMMVRDLQRVIGKESRTQVLTTLGKLPDAVVACVGGGSNSIGQFYEFIPDDSVRLIGVEAAGHGVDTNMHAASIGGGRLGVLHGSMSYVVQNDDGQIEDTHSISAGLDYPGVGPEHAFLQSIGRVTYTSAEDNEALEEVRACCSMEGILPALESAHAFVGAKKWAKKNQGKTVLIGLSGRGDKDMPTLSKVLKI